MSRRARMAIAGTVALVVAVFAVGLRVAVSCKDEISTADGAAAAGLENTAIEAYARAARWYLPFSSCHNRGRSALLELGRKAEQEGRKDVALRAFRELRGSILGTRWLITPDMELLNEANIAIARLMAQQDRAERGENALGEEGHLELLRRDFSPNPWLSAGAVLLFIAWVAALLSGAWRGVMSDGTVRWRVVGIHAGATVVLLLLWLITLRLA